MAYKRFNIANHQSPEINRRERKKCKGTRKQPTKF